MDNQTQELTPEEYKVRVLKSRFAERVTEYEDVIAELITQNAQQQQRIQELEGNTNGVVEEEEDDA